MIQDNRKIYKNIIELINKDLYESLSRIEKRKYRYYYKHHRFINNLELKGTNKSKLKTLSQLIVYKNSKDKSHAFSVCLTNYLNNLNITLIHQYVFKTYNK